MSIVRIGMGENKKYADGFDAIFSKKKAGGAKKSTAKATAAPKKKAPKKTKK